VASVRQWSNLVGGPPCPEWKLSTFQSYETRGRGFLPAIALAIRTNILSDLGARCVCGCHRVVNTAQLTKRYSDALATCVPVTDCKPHCAAPHIVSTNHTIEISTSWGVAALAIHQCHTRRRPSAASPSLLQRYVFPLHCHLINGQSRSLVFVLVKGRDIRNRSTLDQQ
jgi:hypothetical protein